MPGPKTSFNAELAPVLADPEVVNLAPFPFAITDIETGEFVYVNDLYRNQFGMVDNADQQTNISSLYTDLRVRAQLVEKIISTGRLTDVNVCLKQPDGSLVHVLGSAQLVRFNGRLCALISAVDITKMKQLTDDLENVQMELRQALDITAKLQDAAERDSLAKSTLLVNLSHEIKTPLNGIIGMSQMLADEDVSSEIRTYIEAIQQAALSLHGVTNEILENIELDSEDARSHQTLTDPAEVISKAISQIAYQIRNKQLEVSTVIAQAVPNLIEIDKDRLRQALTHLLNNAIKFTESGTITISCDYSLDHLSFSVSDTGVGIPTERVGDIFHEFLQVDNGSTRRYGGIGLGLSIARKAVECIGGEIHVHSVENEGSTFTIMVPVLAPTSATNRTSKDVGRKTTIFTDSPEMARMYDNVLSNRGFSSEVSSLEGWDGTFNLTDDLVLLDLPNDAEVCQNIVARLSGVPEMIRNHVVCLAHRHTFPDPHAAASLAPIRFISKPTDPYNLCVALSSRDIWNSPNVEEPANQDAVERQKYSHVPNTVFLPIVESIERDWGDVDEQFVHRIASLLGESCQRCLEGITLGIDRQDPVLVYAYAYQLYGSTLNAGAIAVAHQCRQVLEAAKQRSFASAEALLPLIRADLNSFQESIDWQLNRKEA